MKKTSYFLLCLIMALLSCEKENFEDNTGKYNVEINMPNLPPAIDEVAAWGYIYTSTKMHQVPISRCKKTETGFTVYLDTPLHNKFLYRIGGAADFTDATFSNPDVMCYNGLSSFRAYSKGRYVGWLSSSNAIKNPKEQLTPENQVSYWVRYIYVDGDVTVTGTVTNESGELYKKFNLNLKKGWNRYLVTEYPEADRTQFPQIEYVSDIPEDKIWWNFDAL